MINIFFLANDFSSLPGILSTIELFNTANIIVSMQTPGTAPIFDCKIVTSEKKSGLFCDGLEISLNKTLKPFVKADVVIASGFIFRNIAELENKIEKSKSNKNWLQRQYDNGAIIGAGCSGTALIAETGLLNGITATTSWWLEHFFRKRYPDVNVQIDQILVEHDRIITAGAVTSILNLALAIIRKTAGNQLALTCSKMLTIDINKHSQSQYAMFLPLLNHSDKLVTEVQYFLNGHFQKKIDMKKLAKQHAVSYRTLVRRFVDATGTPPIKYLQRVRIEAVKTLLETSDLNINSIIERVGYSDLSSFSQLFKRMTNLTPTAYKKNFSTIGFTPRKGSVTPKKI